MRTDHIRSDIGRYCEWRCGLFRLSPYNLVLQEVERLWGLADPFISHKLSLRDGRAKTVTEHQAIQPNEEGPVR
jgi:hypothetical protein